MADVFVSYARADRERVAPIVAALEARGLSVWWDSEIAGGQEFDELITRELDAAKAAVVVWTPTSVASRWVRGEARFAADREMLTPIQLDRPSLPLDFRAIHTIDFDGWGEDAQSRPFQELMRALGGRLGAAPEVQPGRPKAAPKGVSICVLPFANMSRDEDQEYFADGISEDIITDLSKVSALSVISRNSSFTFKGKHVDLPQVARQLQVTHVLEGSVRKAGARVRITAQLIDAATNGHVWAERYDRDLEDIFALQDEISQEIVKALKLTLFPEERKAIEDRRATSVEAYDLYLRARALHRQQGAVELRRAIQMFDDVVALDPGFVPAWRALQEAHEDALVYDAESTEDALAGLARAAERVLALTPDAWWSQVLRSRQLALGHQWAEAVAAAQAAIALAPPSELDPPRACAVVLAAVGRIRDSTTYLEAAIRIDPLSLLDSSVLQAIFTNDGRFEAAEAEYERSKDLPGDREIAEHYASFRALQRRDEARARELIRRAGDVETLSVAGLGELAALLDDPQGMLGRLRKAQPDPANQDSTRQYKIAVWSSWLGDTELSLAALRRFAIDLPGARYGALWSPILAPTRRTEGFKAIVRELGIDDYWRSTGCWGDFARPVGEDDFEIVR